jgi:hypothetical protein
MQAVILALAVLSAPLLIASAAFGYAAAYGVVSVGRHITVALIATMIVMLSHTVTIFYFVGTGSAIERETEERGLDRLYLDEAKRFRKRLFPWALAATFLTMFAAMFGGGVHVGSLSPLVHHLLALLTLVSNGVALARVPGALARNNQLLDAAATAVGTKQAQREN